MMGVSMVLGIVVGIAVGFFKEQSKFGTEMRLFVKEIEDEFKNELNILRKRQQWNNKR